MLAKTHLRRLVQGCIRIVWPRWAVPAFLTLHRHLRHRRLVFRMATGGNRYHQQRLPIDQETTPERVPLTCRVHHPQVAPSEAGPGEAGGNWPVSTTCCKPTIRIRAAPEETSRGPC